MLLGAGRVSEGEAWLRRGAGTRNPMLAAWDAAGRALVTMLRGGTDGVDADFARAAELAGRTGDPNIAGSVLAWHAQWAAMHGAADEWVEPVLSALDRCTRTGAGQAVSILATAALVVLGATGEWETAEAIWAAYATAARRRDTRPSCPDWRSPRQRTPPTAATTPRSVTRIELARSVAASLDRQHEVAAADTWLAAVALVEGDTARADRLALGAAGVLVHSELAGFQYDLAMVLAAVAAGNGRPDDAAIIAGLATAAAPGDAHRRRSRRCSDRCCTTGSRSTTADIDAGPDPLVDAIRYATRGRALHDHLNDSDGSRSPRPSAASSPSPAKASPTQRSAVGSTSAPAP